jgi:SAM-dependent methyltransferase
VPAWRLFEAGAVPECATAEWYAGREAAPHLEQPGGHRERLLLTHRHVAALAAEHGLSSVVDLGCGDGGLLSLLEGVDAWGYDLCPANVEAAGRRGVKVELLDLVADEPRWAEVAVATELLEHLIDPHGFLRRIRERCRFLVCSSPADETPDQHPDYHLWAFDTAGYQELLIGTGWRPLRHQLVGRFQVISAVAT